MNITAGLTEILRVSEVEEKSIEIVQPGAQRQKRVNQNFRAL